MREIISSHTLLCPWTFLLGVFLKVSAVVLWLLNYFTVNCCYEDNFYSDCFEVGLSEEKGLLILHLRLFIIPGVTCNNTGCITDFDLIDLHLYGTLPSSISNFRSLTHMVMTNNFISGTIPDTIGFLTLLRNLNLASNNFAGAIPDSMGNLRFINVLDLESNLLTDKIPSNFGNLNSLISLNLGSNCLTGTIPDSISTMKSLQMLVLDDNSLEGLIPNGITAMTSLRVLLLSRNSISGPLPFHIGALIQLAEFACSENKLTGTIPSSVSALTKMTKVDLNNNYLSIGTASTVHSSTFPTATFNGYFNLSKNCSKFTSFHPFRDVFPSQCSPTRKWYMSFSGTLINFFFLFLFDYLFALLSLSTFALSQLDPLFSILSKPLCPTVLHMFRLRHPHHRLSHHRLSHLCPVTIQLHQHRHPQHMKYLFIRSSYQSEQFMSVQNTQFHILHFLWKLFHCVSSYFFSSALLLPAQFIVSVYYSIIFFHLLLIYLLLIYFMHLYYYKFMWPLNETLSYIHDTWWN